MIDTAVWVLVILAGVMALGVAESARSGRLAGVNWASVKTFAVGAAVILIAVISGILAVTWAIVVLLVEIWQPVLIFMGAVSGALIMLILFFKQRSMFYVSGLAAAAVGLLLLL